MELNHHHAHHLPYNNVSDCQPFLASSLHHHLTSNNEFHLSDPSTQLPHYPQAFTLMPAISNYEHEIRQMKELADSSSGMVQVKDEPYDLKPSQNFGQDEG